MQYAVIVDENHPLSGSTVVIEKATKTGVEASLLLEDLTQVKLLLASEQYSLVASDLVDDFWLKIGDRIHHVKDTDSVGEVIYLDFNLILAGRGVTTCLVLWEGENDVADIQWTNKLRLIEGGN